MCLPPTALVQLSVVAGGVRRSKATQGGLEGGRQLLVEGLGPDPGLGWG